MTVNSLFKIPHIHIECHNHMQDSLEWPGSLGSTPPIFQGHHFQDQHLLLLPLALPFQDQSVEKDKQVLSLVLTCT